VPPPPSPVAAAVPAPTQTKAPDFVPPGIELLAPAPRVRVGLSTTARGVRLTSSRPFRVGSPGRFVETQDVLVETGQSIPSESSVFRIQLRSFTTRADALSFRRATIETAGLDEELSIWREEGSGRFAVRLGAFEAEATARARMRDLVALGLEGLETVRESTSSNRPQELVLRPRGQAEMRTDALALTAVPSQLGSFIEVDGAPYRGYLELFINRSNRFTIVNIVHLEDYLKGVVPAELSPTAFPEKEAVKAQALAARTYVMKRSGQFSADGYDICATPACQVYRGVSVEHPMSNDAIGETSGEVLTYEGVLVDALYTSTCGGRTENSENIFSTAFPYLVSRVCFLEGGGSLMRAAPGQRPASLELTVLNELGIAPDRGALDGPASGEETLRLVRRTVAALGQENCLSDDAFASGSVDSLSLSRVLGEALCWERRLPFLMSTADASRWGPFPEASERDHRFLAFAVHQGIVQPPREGFLSRRALARADVVDALYRLLVLRGEPALRPATVLRVGGGRIMLRDDSLSDRDNQIATTLSPNGYLFRRSAEATTYYTSELFLLPGDEVEIRIGDAGIDVLVLASEGATFDRSSRMSHWVVRKSNEDLSRGAGLQEQVGDVVDLRPTRYGRSGRIIELSVVGTYGNVTLRGLAIRRALGIRENLFFLDAQRAPSGAVESWVFTGRGWGHGVGLCQVGAYGMAAAGFGYRDILRHYYPGTEIVHRTPSAGLGAR